MAKINTHYQKLQAGYLFPEIGKRVRTYAAAHPEARIIRLGIGDVVLPLPAPIVDALKAGADEMARKETFRGYGPEQGYDFLLDAIAAHYRSQGAQVASDEIFVSDGAKCDTANMQEIFSVDSAVAVTDPVYPVYVDTNVMAGRTGPADEKGPLRAPGLLAHHRGKWLRPTPARGPSGPGLSLLAQQPDWRGHVARLAGALGDLGQATRGHHPLRRGL